MFAHYICAFVLIHFNYPAIHGVRMFRTFLCATRYVHLYFAKRQHKQRIEKKSTLYCSVIWKKFFSNPAPVRFARKLELRWAVQIIDILHIF